MYSCGPTVYAPVHVGNLRAFVFADILKRAIEHLGGYRVRHVMNITDVGHLVSDADEGEDKVERAASREGATVEQIVGRYTEKFFQDLDALGIERALHYPRASQHIPEQIALISALETRGYTYRTDDGIYFDTSRFGAYGEMAHLDIAGLRAGARVTHHDEKKNSTDFALWKFSPKDGPRRAQEWPSPWGVGFPGWHLECSAMSMKYLGETLDIHTGGIDHIPVHHTNEIAQSECATGKPFARYFLHSAFMNVDGQKMSKSLGNTYGLEDLAAHGISPMGFRYWLLTAHYRTTINLTWDALIGAEQGLRRLRGLIEALPEDAGPVDPVGDFSNTVVSPLADDLDTPKAIANLWEALRGTDTPAATKRRVVRALDRILGLSLETPPSHSAVPAADIPPEVTTLLQQRESFRSEKRWEDADRIRHKIERLGYEVIDRAAGGSSVRHRGSSVA
jgi:cysteinyl-tRNA synthetase